MTAAASLSGSQAGAGSWSALLSCRSMPLASDPHGECGDTSLCGLPGLRSPKPPGLALLLRNTDGGHESSAVHQSMAGEKP